MNVATIKAVDAGAHDIRIGEMEAIRQAAAAEASGSAGEQMFFAIILAFGLGFLRGRSTGRAEQGRNSTDSSNQ